MTQQLIIYERTPSNAPALSRLSTLDLREVRNLEQARSAMEEAPSSVVALEARPDNLVQTIEAARWGKSRFPMALIAMPSRSLDHCWNRFLFESGVDLIFRSNLDLYLVSRLIQRQCSRSETLEANDEPISFREQIWQRLPWKRHTSNG